MFSRFATSQPFLFLSDKMNKRIIFASGRGANGQLIINGKGENNTLKKPNPGIEAATSGVNYYVL